MDDKKILRKLYIDKRRNMNDEEVLKKSIIIQKKFLESGIYKDCKKIGIYLDFNNEVKTDLIIEKALLDNKEVYVPKIKKENFMDFYKIDKFTKYYLNKFKIKEPSNISINFQNDCFPSVFVVPGIIFSKDGNRVGYGGGYYDRWIEKNSNNIYVGLAYDFQVTNDIPSFKYDKKMDYIISESGFIKSIK